MAGFQPSSLDFIAHPYDVYAELRAGPRAQYYPPTDQWLVPRHADVTALLKDRRLGRTYLHVATHAEFGRPPDEEWAGPFWRVVRAGMLDTEPPDHTRLRRLVSSVFTPRRVAGLAPRIEALADGLVDDLLDAGSGSSPVDLMRVVAEPLPVTVVAELLGVPPADRHLLRPWSEAICGMYELNPSRAVGEAASAAAVEFGDYLRELADARRGAPTGDLVSALVEVADGGERLTTDELVGTCVLLLNAGHEATVNTTGNGWWALFRNPAELDRLRGDPGLLGTAVDELLRWDTPLQMFERWVLADIEVDGVAIPRGAEVALLFGSANRDPAVFVDPDRLDLGREDNPHVSFGLGIHYCLGAALARLELRTLFGALLRRVPRMALAAEPRWRPRYVVRGLSELLVTVG